MDLVRVVLSFLIIVMLSACGNPLGGGESSSDITDGHDPLDPADNDLGAFVLSGVTTGATSADISWTNSTNADSYKLEYGTTSGTYTTTIANATSPTPITGLSSGINYYFLVTASNEDGERASNEIAVGTIGTFAITGVTSQQGGATVSWANATGATNYKVSYGTTSGVYPTVASNNATSPQVITGLTPGTTYYFKVEARNSSTTQLSSNQMSAVPLGGFTMSGTPGASSANISWTASAGATSYTLKYGTASGVYGTTHSTSATTPVTVSTLTPGTTYYFMVEAVNATGSVEASAEVAVIPYTGFTMAATAGIGSANVTWTASTGATAYTLKYGTASGVYGTTVSANATSPSTISSLTPGTTYYVMVEARNSSGTWNAASEVAVTPMSAFAIGTPTIGAGSVTLTWGASTGATAYTLKYGTASGVYGTTHSASAISPTTVTGLTPGTTYYFMVEATNSSGAINANAEVSATPIGAFTMAAASGDTAASISWTAAAGATSYTVKYGTATGVYGNTFTTAGTTPTNVTGLLNNTVYYFMVTAVNANGSRDATAEASTTVGLTSAADSLLVATIPKDLMANGTTTNLVTVTTKTTSGTLLSGKVVTLTSSRGATDTITAVSATTNSSGEATFNIKSSTSGAAVLTGSVSADSVTVTQTDTVYFFPEHANVDLLGRYAQSTIPAQNNPGATTTWSNVGTGGASYNGSLSGFGFDSALSTSRWGGDGTTSITTANNGQHRLIFDGVDDVLSLGTSLNSNSSIAYDAWVRPTTLTRGKVLISNSNNAGKGLTLKQSWDGQGRLTLHPGHQTYADVIAADNPIGYWRLGEVSGTTFYNSSSYTSLNGTKVAGVTNGGVGVLANDNDTAATFTKPGGDNGTITIPDHVNMDGGNAFSIEVWVNLATGCSGASVNCGIISKRIGAADNEAYILYSSNKKPFFRLNGITGAQLESTTTMVEGTWYHLVATFDGSLADTGVSPSAAHRMKLYINGTLSQSKTNTATTVSATASHYEIGHLAGNITSGWSGRIDEVAHYNYALTAAQVSAHYNASTLHAVQSSGNMTAGTWAHVASSFDGTTGALNLNLNGSNANKIYASTNIATSTTNWNFGASNYTGANANFWDGSIAEFRAYLRAFTSSELNSCYSTTSSKYP